MYFFVLFLFVCGFLHDGRSLRVICIFCLFFFFDFILQLIYNVVLVPGVQQSDSFIHINISILFQILFHIGYYRILSRGPCAIKEVLVDYLFYIYQCVFVNPKLLVYPSTPCFPFGNHKFVFEVCESVQQMYFYALHNTRLDVMI